VVEVGPYAYLLTRSDWRLLLAAGAVVEGVVEDDIDSSWVSRTVSSLLADGSPRSFEVRNLSQ